MMFTDGLIEIKPKVSKIYKKSRVSIYRLMFYILIAINFINVTLSIMGQMSMNTYIAISLGSVFLLVAFVFKTILKVFVFSCHLGLGIGFISVAILNYLG